MRILSSFAVLYCLAFSSLQPARAQQASSSSAQIPDSKYYSLIFRHILYLQAHGEPPANPGAPSPSIAHFYSDRVGASDSENAVFLSEAQAWKSEVDPVDQQAHSIIAAIHAQTPGGHLVPASSLPRFLPNLLPCRPSATPSR
jgi:hypothetical protein